MRLLLDENVARDVTHGLRRDGWRADHVLDLDLASAGDETVLAYALREGYDAVVTLDMYGQRRSRLAALEAMNAGLRVIQLRFRSGENTPEMQLAAVVDQADEIAACVSADSDVRRLLINGSSKDVTRQSVASVRADLQRLRRRGQR